MKKIIQMAFVFGVILSSIGLLKVGYYHSKALLAQHLMNAAWSENQQMISHTAINQSQKNALNPAKPWPWADTWPALKITLPSIQLSQLVLKDASGESLAFGPGLMTPNIEPGMIGNSFIAAHRDTHFAKIGDLQLGDPIIIEQATGEQQNFVIDQIIIIDSRDQQPIVDSQSSRLTLVTCYPFDAKEANTPYRYLVSAIKNHQSAETMLANLQK